MSVSYKRVAVCYFLVTVFLFICAFRVFAVMKEKGYSEAAGISSSRVVTLGIRRGTVFDCNMERLTNSTGVIYAVIFDEPEAIAALYQYFTGSQIEKIIEEIRGQGFAVRTVTRNIECDGIYCFRAYSHTDDSTVAKHVIGYTDAGGKGVCGIEAAYDSRLSGSGENTVTFQMSGHGEVLAGEEPILDYDYGIENCGVRITIDKEIQQIAEQEAMAIAQGALVITEVQTGKIRAMVSRPDYKLSDLSAAVQSEAQPLLNRALATYNIGSVFKPYVSAAGYEWGISANIECVGYTDVDGLTFACHNLGGHGVVDMTHALKFSCNSFFYRFIQDVGAERVFSVARKAGFESSIYLADGIVCRAGSLGNTGASSLSKRALANLSIGQGELMLSPLAITNMYMAIAGDGCYRTPSLVEGVIENGKLTGSEALPARVRVMSESTAKRLKADLKTVLEEGGTGESGRPSLTTAAGKTGTAQTGIVRDGKKVVNSWFCGFFPLNDPKYAVTVVSENSTSGCAPVFAAVADAVTLLEEKRTAAID